MDDGTTGPELWKYDGTRVSRLADINPGADGSFPSHLMSYKHELYFAADDDNTGHELWKLTP